MSDRRKRGWWYCPKWYLWLCQSWNWSIGADIKGAGVGAGADHAKRVVEEEREWKFQ